MVHNHDSSGGPLGIQLFRVKQHKGILAHLARSFRGTRVGVYFFRNETNETHLALNRRLITVSRLGGYGYNSQYADQ